MVEFLFTHVNKDEMCSKMHVSGKNYLSEIFFRIGFRKSSRKFVFYFAILSCNTSNVSRIGMVSSNDNNGKTVPCFVIV